MWRGDYGGDISFSPLLERCNRSVKLSVYNDSYLYTIYRTNMKTFSHSTIAIMIIICLSLLQWFIISYMSARVGGRYVCIYYSNCKLTSDVCFHKSAFAKGNNKETISVKR